MRSCRVAVSGRPLEPGRLGHSGRALRGQKFDERGDAWGVPHLAAANEPPGARALRLVSHRPHEPSGSELRVDERAVHQRNAAAAERELERERKRVHDHLGIRGVRHARGLEPQIPLPGFMTWTPPALTASDVPD